MVELSPADAVICEEVRTWCACNKVRRAARAVTRRYEVGLAPSHVKATQLPILVGLSTAGRISIAPLAEILGVDRTTLTRNLRVLERDGLVTMVAKGSDGRRAAELSDLGVRTLAAALPAWRETQAAIEREFGASRLQALFTELSALADAVRD
jgi:DNA-binding MarR family transcriptional regulator